MPHLPSDRILVILGMHRSGTSLITQWLNKSGLSVGENLIGPGAGNTEGHFEDLDFCNIHQEILALNNLPDTGIISAGEIRVSDYHKKELRNMIGLKSLKFNGFGWKDPRTCLFLKTYRELLPEARYLLIVRDYAEVVTSLLKRDFRHVENDWLFQHTDQLRRWKWKLYKRENSFKKFASEYAAFFLEVYNHYNRELLTHLQKIPLDDFIVVNYKNLITRDKDLFAILSEEWDFHLDYTPFGSVYKPHLMSKKFSVDDFIEPGLAKEARRLETQLMAYTI